MPQMTAFEMSRRFVSIIDGAADAEDIYAVPKAEKASGAASPSNSTNSAFDPSLPSAAGSLFLRGRPCPPRFGTSHLLNASLNNFRSGVRWRSR